MNSKTFSIGEALKFGWKAMKEHFFLFFGVILLAFIAVLLPAILSQYFYEKSPIIYILCIIAQFLLSSLVHLGYVKISLNMLDKNKARLIDLFTPLNKLFSYIVANFLFMLILIAGFLLLIFPACIWGCKFFLYPYLIVDKNMGPIEALKAASKISYGAKWELFAFILCIYLILIAGILCLGIGIFAAIPIVLVATAYAYRRLTKQTEL